MPRDKINDKELAKWIKEVEAQAPKRKAPKRRPKAPDKKAAQPSPPPDDQHLSENHDSAVPGANYVSVGGSSQRC